MGIKTSVVALAIVTVSPHAGAATISAYDQYTLELINLFRADPQAQAKIYLADKLHPEGNLNEGLPAGTISSSAKQPLAWNQSLVTSAQAHTTDMIANNFFDHPGSNGSSPFQRMNNAGYNYQTAGENLATRGQTGLTGVTSSITELLNSDLFVDEGVTGRGHRTNMLDGNYESVGISVGFSPDYTPLEGFPSDVVTIDFGSNSQGPFLTGVAYDDSDNNAFYTPGEGLGGVTVSAFIAGTTTLQATTTTYDAGGYALNLGAGVYDLQIDGPFGREFIQGQVIGNQNIKLDYTALSVVPVPVPAAIWLFASGLLGIAGGFKRRVKV